MLHWWVWQRGGWPLVLACASVTAALGCGGKAADAALVPGSAGKAPASNIPSASGPTEHGLTLPQPETCADNPLLAGCLGSSSPAPSLTPTPAPVPPSAGSRPVSPASSPLAAVEDLLLERCGDCHGPARPELCGTCDGMYDIQDLRVMIQTGKVVPCHWRDSVLYRRMADGSMPPAGFGPGLSASEQRQVGEVVDGLCSDLTDPSPDNADAPEIERWLAADCGSCHGSTPDAGVGPEPRGIDGVNDISELLAAGLIVPCDAEGSELVRVLRDNSMPPSDVSGPGPVRSQLRQLIAFIDRPCSRR